MMDRAKMLEDLISKDPNDPFLHYGLAMEVSKSSPQKAIELFEKILNKFPTYLPAYYQAAVLLIGLNEEEKAIDILQSGILLAKSQTELKTMGELRTLLDQLEE